MTRPAVKTTASIQAYAEMELRDYLTDFNKIWASNTSQVSSELEKETQTAIDTYKQLFDDMTKGMWSQDMKDFVTWVETTTTVSDVESKAAMQVTAEIRKNFNKIISLPYGQQQSHADFSNLSGHLYILYTGLVKLKGTTAKLSKYIDASGQPSNLKIVWKPQQLARLTEYTRRLWVTSKALAEMPIGKFTGDALNDIDKALGEYFKNTNQQEHFLKKETQIDVLTGKANQKIVFETQFDRSAAELLLGGDRYKRRLGNMKKSAVQGILKKYRGNFGKIAGSKSIEKEIVTQLTDIAKGKKPKAYKNKSTYKKKAPATKNKIKGKITKAVAASLAVKAMGKMAETPKRRKRTTTEGEDARAINKLKRQLNKRLPAEVRRNAQRPYLMTRTGIFSESVEIVNLKQGPKTLVADYTYMKTGGGISKNRQGVYSTFENMGVKKWPLGYNPKLLIAKSIRRLATEYTDQKFTLRRV